MPAFLCRWPNGEFSIVSARTRDDAVFLLDEWGNAEHARIRRLDDCMFDYRLNDDGEIELSQIGERTLDSVMTFCYPHLDEAFSTAESDKDGYTERGREAIHQAITRERTGEWDTQPEPKQADTELGRRIQQRLGAASVVANRAVQRVAREKLESSEGEGAKPN